jgi:hypothetical protein
MLTNLPCTHAIKKASSPDQHESRLEFQKGHLRRFQFIQIAKLCGEHSLYRNSIDKKIFFGVLKASSKKNNTLNTVTPVHHRNYTFIWRRKIPWPPTAMIKTNNTLNTLTIICHQTILVISRKQSPARALIAAICPCAENPLSTLSPDIHIY